MKKVLVLLLTLSLVGAHAFAQDAAPVPEFKPVVTIEGDASVTFGIDLDTKANGIANKIGSNLKIQLVTKAAAEKGAKEGEAVYGWIKLKDFEALVNKDDGFKLAVPGVEAKLFLGPVYINILGDGAGTGKTIPGGILRNDADDGDLMDLLGLTETTVPAKVEYKSSEAKQDNVDQQGIVIGLVDTSIVDVKLGVSSLYDWTADSTLQTTKTVAADYTLGTGEAWVNTTWANSGGVVIIAAAADAANKKGIYNFWASADLKAVENLSVGVKVGARPQQPTSSPLGLGVSAGYKVALAEGYSVTPTVAFDAVFSKDMAYRIGAGVVLSVPGAKKDDWDKFGTKRDIKPGFSVQFAVDNAKAAAGAAKDNMDMTVAFFDADLIPVVNVIAVGEFFGLTTAKTMGLGVFADADLGMVVPYAGFKAKMDDKWTDYLVVYAGFDLKVITNTTFTVGYKSGDISSKPDPLLGTLEFTTKIAF